MNDTALRCTPTAVWKEDDMIGAEKVKAMVVILRTKGCWWAFQKGCTMCGYNVESDQGISTEDLRAQLASVKSKYAGEPMVKVYTSGSFLDEREIPLEMRAQIFDAFPQARKIIFETRPEFVTDETLASIPKEKALVALGLESADDEVLRRSIRKGFTSADYLKAAETLKRHSIPVRTYLLLKPPFMTEAAAIRDTIASIDFARPYSESISINPVNVQSGTIIEDMWRRGDYRSPWIWSLLEVLKAGWREGGPRLFSSPSGAGTLRGVHNCANCDRKVLDAVQRFSYEQDPKCLEGLECGCKDEWRALLQVQDLMATTVDLSRHLEDEILL
jgi:radical SAM enzyme (TIGR01210 family)